MSAKIIDLALREKVEKATKHREREEKTILRFQKDRKDIEKESIRQYLETVDQLRKGVSNSSKKESKRVIS